MKAKKSVSLALALLTLSGAVSCGGTPSGDDITPPPILI